MMVRLYFTTFPLCMEEAQSYMVNRAWLNLWINLWICQDYYSGYTEPKLSLLKSYSNLPQAKNLKSQ